MNFVIIRNLSPLDYNGKFASFYLAFLYKNPIIGYFMDSKLDCKNIRSSSKNNQF